MNMHRRLPPSPVAVAHQRGHRLIGADGHNIMLCSGDNPSGLTVHDQGYSVMGGKGDTDASLEPRRIYACLMLLYGVFLLTRHTLPQIKREHPVCDVIVAAASGLLGGAASLSGVLPSMWAALQPWSKQETSAILRPFNVVILGLATAVYVWRGFFTLNTLVMMAIAIPATLIASQAGVAVYKRLSETAFKHALLWLMIGGAASLILRETFLAL